MRCTTLLEVLPACHETSSCPQGPWQYRLHGSCLGCVDHPTVAMNMWVQPNAHVIFPMMCLICQNKPGLARTNSLKSQDEHIAHLCWCRSWFQSSSNYNYIMIIRTTGKYWKVMFLKSDKTSNQLINWITDSIIKLFLKNRLIICVCVYIYTFNKYILCYKNKL